MPGLPLIVDVKRHSLEDGPGIRSVVFFKGCPLRCVFCQNPEAQLARAEIAFRADRCVECGACVLACPAHAASLASPGRIDRSHCDVCGKCAAACPSSALAVIGRTFEVDDLVELLARDEPFYRHSGGGVTFSGGECTMFPDYLAAVARALKARGIHTAVETCGEFAGAMFVERLLPQAWLAQWYRFRPYGILVLFLLVIRGGVLDHLFQPFLDHLQNFVFQ